MLDETYRRYLKERPVEQEDAWAVDRLCETGLLRIHLRDGRVHAYARPSKRL